MTNSGKFDPRSDLQEEIHNQTAHKNFLGREFLTWLWYFAETNDGRFEFTTGDHAKKSAQFWIDDRIVLTSKTGKSHEHIIKGGVPSTSDEADISLKAGKSVKEMRIAMEVDGSGLFHATLGGDDLSPKSLILPELNENAEESAVDQRIEAVNLFSSALDTLFSKFMDERTDKLWETTRITSIRNWIKTRRHEPTTIH